MEYIAILCGLILYTLYIVLPLLPAVIIYKIFPNTTVGASGILGNLKINATGAFAAYIITVILGHFVIQKNLDLIDELKSTTWEITSKVVLVDCSNKPVMGIYDSDIKDKLEIKTTPDYTEKSLGAVVFMAYVKGTLPKVTFSYPGFESKMIDLALDSVKRDFSERKINIGSINLRRCNQEYIPEHFMQDSATFQTLNGPPTN